MLFCFHSRPSSQGIAFSILKKSYYRFATFWFCSRPTTQQLFLNCQAKRVTFRLQWTTIKLTLPLLQMREGG